MDITIQPGLLKGKVKIPPSKSIAHRAIICAALANGVSTIENIELSDDILVTIKAMTALGACIKCQENVLKIKGIPFGAYENKQKGGGPIKIDCNESGSTLRFLIPITISFGGSFRFIGKGNLGKRPLDPYYRILEKQRIFYKAKEEKLDLEVQGRLKPGTFSVPGNVSSQFISGLLFALPLLKGDSTIEITTPLESIAYIDLTLRVLKSFGVSIYHSHYQEFFIEGNQRFYPQKYRVEGDYSQGAFFLVADALGSEVMVEDLVENSLQGDRMIIDILKRMGVPFFHRENGLQAVTPDILQATKIDGSQCPDIIPILTGAACFSKGTTKIINAGRLRMKESDRLFAIYQELTKLGAKIEEHYDGLTIKGVTKLRGNQTLWSHKDHRIAMTLAIVATICDGPIKIQDAQCVSKSYPGFWEDFKALGGILYE